MIMKNNYMKTHKELMDEIGEMDRDDLSLQRLEKAVEWYCGAYWKAYGMQRALIMELDDQYNNHPEDQKQKDIKKISDILNGLYD